MLPLLYVLEAAAFAALGLHRRRRVRCSALVLALALVDGTLAITGRGLTRGAVAAVLQPAGLLREGNALMNLGFAHRLRRRRRARGPAHRHDRASRPRSTSTPPRS